MSKVEVELCGIILSTYYGEIISKVCSTILAKDRIPLKLLLDIVHDVDRQQVKKAICVLMHHNMVTCSPHPRGYLQYSANSDQVLHHIRFPRLIYAAKTLFEDPAELIVEELVQHGRRPMSTVVKSVTDRLKEALNGSADITIEKVHEAFKRLAETRFINRSPRLLPAGEEDEDKENDKMFTLPDPGCLYQATVKDEGEEPAAKRRKVDKPKHDDTDVLWRVNVERFTQHLRDQAIVSAVHRRTNKRAAEVVRNMLRLAEVKCDPAAAQTHHMTIHEIKKTFVGDDMMSITELQQHLTLLMDEEMGAITKVDESGGGMYVVNIEKAIYSLAVGHLESYVQERFGVKSLRIFRLVLKKQHMEQKQIEQETLLPTKEAKERLFTLMQENIVSLTEVSKAADHAPARTFYLFRVQLGVTAGAVLRRCHVTAARLMSRARHEHAENRRLLDKWARIEAITASLSASGASQEQIDDISDMMAPAEKQQLARLNTATRRLDMAVLQLDETLLVLELYLRHCCRR